MHSGDWAEQSGTVLSGGTVLISEALGCVAPSSIAPEAPSATAATSALMR